MISLTSDKKTPLHSMPAGVKLWLLAAATVLLFYWPPSAFVLGAGLGLGYISLGLGKEGLRLLRGALVFAALIFIGQWVWGDPLLGATTALRLLVLVAAANLVTLTTKLAQMIAAFERLLQFCAVPEALRRQIALALGLAIRFLPVLGERLEALRMAWRARSARAGGWRLVLPLLVSCLDDADRIGEALRARGGLE